MRTRAGETAVVALLAALAALLAAAPAQAASTDSMAPATAPPHWLPPEAWVYNHWLPYDEGRLYALLNVSRGAIWRQLRDDRNAIAQLARRRGWPSARKLANRLVAPRAPGVTPKRLRELRRAALMTLTQGHLAQHLLFHSLHQFAIPSEAPAIFGVTDAEFRLLRRGEQSPLEIGRLHGRSPATIEALSADVLRERVAAGVRSKAMSARQGAVLLRRQLSQLPRWLAQVRYNGPPPTHDGKLTSTPRDYAANPSLAAGGARVVFEAYQQKLPLALAKGEISVRSHALPAKAGGVLTASQPNRDRSTPRSAYNPSVSRDGRLVAFESAEGNLNFAKRYGQIRVFVRDTVAGRTRAIGRPPAGPGYSRSEYNPVIAAGGTHVAYQAVRRGGQSAVYVCDLKTGRSELASRGDDAAAGADAGVYEPSISADGAKVAFTSSASNLGAGDLKGRTQVFVRDLVAKTTTLVSRADGADGPIAGDYASEPSISQDGRFVAFTSAAANLGGEARAGGDHDPRVYVRDLEEQTTIALSEAGDGFALAPSISADGAIVAFTAISPGDRRRVLVRDVRTPRAAALVASRAAGADGAPADGPASDPSISADGRLVAFSSTATNLATGKSDDRRGVFVRDLEAHTTALVSTPTPAAARASAGRQAGVPAASAPATAPSGRPARRQTAALVDITDNAFHRVQDRPFVRLRRGGALTWRWRSRQSHHVQVRSGPQRLQSPTQTRGRFTVALRRPGRYTFICTIHAPGMRMTADVR